MITPNQAKIEGFAIPDENLAYGEFHEPIKTGTAYKLFYLKNGKLYPPVIANSDRKETPVGIWLPCASPEISGYTDRYHRPKIKSGGPGTSGRSLGYLAFRPGWHLSEVPQAPQFMRKDGTFPEDLVWALCEYSADVCYQEEAMRNGYVNGKFRYSFAGLQRLPVNGYYRYRTNPNHETPEWIISGAIKVLKII